MPDIDMLDQSKNYAGEPMGITTEVINAKLALTDVVTQLTSISTAVTLNKRAGVITTVALTAAADATEGTFTVNNSFVTSSSVILVTVEYASGATGIPAAIIRDRTTGSFKITIRNQAASGSLNAVAKLHIAVLS